MLEEVMIHYSERNSVPSELCLLLEAVMMPVYLCGILIRERLSVLIPDS